MTAANSVTTLTAPELVQRLGADQKLLPLVDMLIETNQLWSYLAAYNGWRPCNNNLTFKGRRTSTEPTPSERDYDEGVSASVSSQEPYEEPTCTLGDWFKMDLTRLNDQKDKAAVLTDELKGHWRGFSKVAMARLFYGDRDTYAKRIRGFSYRSAYNTLSSSYVYDNAAGNASGTQNKTSCYVIKVGPGAFQCITPENDNREMSSPGVMADVSGMGLFVKDYGDSVPLSDGTNQYPGIQSYMEMRFGAAVHHPGAVRRIANISCTSIDEVDDFSFEPDYLIDALCDIEEAFGDTEGVVIAMPSIVSKHIWKDINHKGNVYHTMTDPYGRRIAAFDNHPIAITNALVKTEATLS